MFWIAYALPVKQNTEECIKYNSVLAFENGFCDCIKNDNYQETDVYPVSLLNCKPQR